MPLYPLALSLIGMAPLAYGLWVAAQDLAAHLNARDAGEPAVPQ